MGRELTGLDLTGVDLPTETVRTAAWCCVPTGPTTSTPCTGRRRTPSPSAGSTRSPFPAPREDARRFVADVAPGLRRDGLGLSVAVEADGEFAGTAGLDLRPGRLGPEIGYSIAPWARGRGYATEAARALADWGLGHGAPRVHLFADLRNAASLAVARRAGFTQEGTVRSCLEYRDGTRGDAALFGLLAGE